MMFLIHVYRFFLVKIANLFKGMHFFAIKRFLLNAAPDISIGDGVKIVGPIWVGTVSEINIGKNTFINRGFSVEGNGKITIGDNVDIGPNVSILTGGHSIGDAEHRAGDGISYKIKIEDGCWVGGYTIILGNVVVQTGDVIGAGTLINKDCPANALLVGCPGKVKKYLV